MTAVRTMRVRTAVALTAALLVTVTAVGVVHRLDVAMYQAALANERATTLVVIEPSLGTVEVPNCAGASATVVEVNVIDLAVPIGALPVCIGLSPTEWITIADDLLRVPRAVYAARGVVPGTAIYLDAATDAGYTLRVCAIDYASGIECGSGAGS
ncbi:MAG: hypothetical protein M3381_09260 [Actinomycetota bacterium]|nr:hypothetical protein [Actinomycetota bacterium]